MNKVADHQQIYQGADYSQPQLKGSLVDTANNAVLEHVSIDDEFDNPNFPASADSPIRKIHDPHINRLGELERTAYNTVNKAAGTDLKSLYDYEGELQDALDDPTNISNRNSLQEELKNTQAQISVGEDLAKSNGVDPAELDTAKSLTQRRYAVPGIEEEGLQQRKRGIRQRGLRLRSVHQY